MQSAATCQSLRAPRAQPARRSRAAVRVSCQQISESQPTAFVAGVIAASLLTASAAHAGVILEQPKLKQTFVQEAVEAAPVEKKAFKAPAPKEAAAPAEAKEAKEFKFEAPEAPELDPRSIALPGAVLGLVGGGFALSKLDEGFADPFINKWLYKDSIENGAGYEEALKAGNIGAVGKGTRAIKSKSKSFFGGK